MELTAFCSNAVSIRTRCLLGNSLQISRINQLFRVKRYGMNLLVTNDDKLLDFLNPLLEQIESMQEFYKTYEHLFRPVSSKATEAHGFGHY
jgi:hypothetical protein